MTTGIIIQARMTSKRFPGKSMALLAGKPVLRHVIERCTKVHGIDRVVVAMPDTKESQPMAELCVDVGQIGVVFGPEDDVLERYYLAASDWNMNTIMRITADCPLIDPKRCHNVLISHYWYKDNYTSNGIDCEVFSFSMLERAHKSATDPYDREHVTPWMKREVANCVDYPEDIQRLEARLVKSN
jgi:spore coat polysaccharide biosynthesis protein SpsF